MGKIKRIISVFAIAFLSLFVVSPVYAADGGFIVESAEVADKSDDVTAGTPTVSGTTIASDVIFRVLEDYVVYNITLKNGGEYDRKIVNIIDDNENNLFEFEYDNHANEIIKAGESTTLDLKVTYKNQNDDDENRDFLSTIKFNISFVELIPAPAEGEAPTETPEKTETIEIVPNVPDTSGFNGIGTNANKDAMIVSLVIAGAGFIAAVILVIKKKGTAASKVAIASLAIIAVAPLTVQAEESSSADFEIASNYKLRDRVKLSFRTMLDDTAIGESTNYYDYGDEPFANTLTGSIYGYSYQGAFNVSDNSRYDFAPLSDDVDINFVSTLDEYDITYDYAGGVLEAGDENPDTYTVKTNFTLKEPVREGFEFLGWYLYGSKIETINNMVGDLELVARWEETPKTLLTISKMQEMTPEICENTTTPTLADYSDTPVNQLIDTRDNKKYWVAKLKDGKCWMTQNLDLDLSTEVALTSADSDLGWNGTGYDDNVSWTPTKSTYIANGSMLNNYTFTDFYPNSIDLGNWYWQGTLGSSGYNFLRSGENELFKQTPGEDIKEHGHVGNYYNWTAAIATNDPERYHTISVSDYSKGPQTSICPKGWRLPLASMRDPYVNTSQDEFTYLYNQYKKTGYTSIEQIVADPMYFVPAGTSRYGDPESAGSMGEYWTSVVYNSSDDGNAHALYFWGSYAGLNGSTMKKYAASVRCVAR